MLKHTLLGRNLPGFVFAEILFIKILAKTEELQKNTSKSIKNGNTIRPRYTWFQMSADSCFLHMRFIGLFAFVDAPGMFYVAL
uniref:Uncharacterized protein n=1 Tax=Lactuca sativa TaxID=4236 RepID=A0A9R1WCP2_LACSA|nr:hypothetical protein LSAT_V11C200090840 [Lactuca sativa]